jgi:hypothetical protein
VGRAAAGSSPVRQRVDPSTRDFPAGRSARWVEDSAGTSRRSDWAGPRPTCPTARGTDRPRRCAPDTGRRRRIRGRGPWVSRGSPDFRRPPWPARPGRPGPSPGMPARSAGFPPRAGRDPRARPRRRQDRPTPRRERVRRQPPHRRPVAARASLRLRAPRPTDLRRAAPRRRPWPRRDAGPGLFPGNGGSRARRPGRPRRPGSTESSVRSPGVAEPSRPRIWPRMPPHR